MSVELLNPPGMPKPLAPYSTATRAGNTIYVSGILALGTDGKTVGAGDVRVQTKHVIETIATILKSEGAALGHVAFNTIIVKDMADYAAVNEVYREYFGSHPPARYCIAAQLVRDEFLVEIASIAHVTNS